jgi:transcription initiation factor TFIID subunit 6
MDPKRSLTTQYGALKGLGLLGEHVVRVLLLPNIKSYLELITPYLNSEASIIHRLEAQQCYGALLVKSLSEF